MAVTSYKRFSQRAINWASIGPAVVLLCTAHAAHAQTVTPEPPVLFGEVRSDSDSPIIAERFVYVVPNSLWFRKVVTGSSEKQNIEIRNPSSEEITLVGIASSDNAFDLTSIKVPTVVGPGETARFDIEYAPSAGDTNTSAVVVDLSFDDGSTKKVSLWGSNVNAIPQIIFVSECRVLDQAGAHYLLQTDLVSDGTCIAITAPHITFDMNGHKITYGSNGKDHESGIFASSDWAAYAKQGMSEGSIEGLLITNGVIEQAGYSSAAPAGKFSHGIALEPQNSSNNIEISNMRISVWGHSAMNIHIVNRYGIHIHDNVLNSKVTQIQDRHQIDGALVDISRADKTGGFNRIYSNVLNGGAQAGIVHGGKFGQIYGNSISQDARFSNDFAIFSGSHTEVFNNTIDQDSGRGIRADFDGVHIYGNNIRAKEKPQNDEYGGCELGGAYGVQIETNVTGVRVYDNQITVLADACDAVGVKVTATRIPGDNRVFGNQINAKRVGSSEAAAVGVAFGESAEGSVLFEDNSITFDGTAIEFGWSGASDFEFFRNQFSLGTNPAAIGKDQSNRWFIRFANNKPVKGINFVDSELKGISDDLVYESAIKDWHGTVEYEISWTLSITLVDAAGESASGANVSIKDNQDRTVFSGASDDAGMVSARLVQEHRRNDSQNARIVENRNPYNISIQKAGFNDLDLEIAVAETKALTCNISNGICN